MSLTGRPEGEHRSAQREGATGSPTGRPEGEHRSAQRWGAAGSPSARQLAAAVGRALVARQARLVTAESCTGGLVAAAITGVAGSSAWFDRGFVTYSNEAKVELLGIDAAALVRDGAVSEETAAAMATGALAHSHADYALAITGIAGPAGGSAGKPVGTVCIAWGRRGAGVAATTLHFPGDRAAVRRASVRMALGGLLQRIADSLPATR